MRINMNLMTPSPQKTMTLNDPAFSTKSTASGLIATTNTASNRAAIYLLKSNLSRDLKHSLNSTTFRKSDFATSASSGGDESNNTVLVVLSVLGIVLIVLGMCCLLCYREISRRRLENGILMEKTRREMLRNAIKSKVEEMKTIETGDDTESYMAVMELKVPLVTFGKVTMISPVPSTESMQSVLDRHLHRHHHHHHHHHHHYHKLDKEDDNVIRY